MPETDPNNPNGQVPSTVPPTGPGTQTPEKVTVDIEDVSLIDTKTFGTDTKKATVEQLKSYKNAVTKMHEATTRAKTLERENEELKTKINSQQVPPSNQQIPQQGGYTQQQIVELEQKYNMPFAQIQALYDVQSLAANQALKPVQEQVNNMMEVMSKNSLEREVEYLQTVDDSLKVPEVKETFDNLINRLPPSERIKRQSVINCLQQAKGLCVDKIVDFKFNILKEQNGSKPPNTPPAIPAPGSSALPNQQGNHGEKEELDTSSQKYRNLKSYYTDDQLTENYKIKKGGK